MNFTEAKKLAMNLKAAYPADTFLTISHAFARFGGNMILDSSSWMVYKLTRSNWAAIHDDQVKEKSMAQVLESKAYIDVEQRKDFLREKLKAIFPQQNVNLFMFREYDSTEYYLTDTPKGKAFFSREYGQAVLILLV